MKRLLVIFDVILIRFLAFSLAFFITLPFIPLTKKESHQILNVEIYKRPANVDCTRPNPLLLLVRIDETNRLLLNNQEFNLADLENKLSEIFKERDILHIKNEGETEIHKTVFIQPDNSVNYEDLIQVIDCVRKAGANHIFIDPFNENCYPLTYGCGFRTKVKSSKKLKINLKDNAGKGNASSFKAKKIIATPKKL